MEFHANMHQIHDTHFEAGQKAFSRSLVWRLIFSFKKDNQIRADVSVVELS